MSHGSVWSRFSLVSCTSALSFASCMSACHSFHAHQHVIRSMHVNMSFVHAACHALHAHHHCHSLHACQHAIRFMHISIDIRLMRITSPCLSSIHSVARLFMTWL
jgi:hypothetical protein